jgi:hypothetical protein
MQQPLFVIAAMVAMLAGCSDAATAPGPTSDYLQMAATTTMTSAGRVQTDVTVTTRIPAGVPIEWGGCTALMRVYRTPERITPVWDASTGMLACPAFLARSRVTPGTPGRFSTDATPAEILGDSLPPGHYYFGALLSLNLGQFDVAAGELDLGR